MKRINLFFGVAVLLLAFTLNMRHAFNDYGVSDPNNELHPQILAQTNTSGDGGGSGGSSSMTSEEFTDKTGCIAIWDYETCDGKDGKRYSYARKP
jgi:hypothetical protein